MKKLLFLIFGLCGFLFSQYPVYTIDTVRFIRPADTLIYASGDIIADSGGHYKYFSMIKINERSTARGKIVNVTVQMDTANATNTTLKARFFTVSDTTGLWASLPLDNAVFQSKFQMGGGYYQWIGDVIITLGIFGTTDGGSTSSEGTATASLMYYGKVYCVLISTGAFEPKINGLFRVIVGADKQY